jgi:uncharacterized protein YegP (UPF0339 family)
MEDGTTQFVDYVKIREEEDGWWYDEYSNNHEKVGNSDEAYSSKGNAKRAIEDKYQGQVRIIEA